MKTIFRALCPFLLLCLPLFAQAQHGQSMKNISPIDQEEMIERFALFLTEKHYDEKIGIAAGDSLRARFKRGVYAPSGENSAIFVEHLNADAQKLLGDGISFVKTITPDMGEKGMGSIFQGWWLWHPSRLIKQQRASKARYEEKHGRSPINISSRGFKKNKNIEDSLYSNLMIAAKHRRRYWLASDKFLDRQLAFDNFGHQEAKILDNRVAYWKISGWAVPQSPGFNDKFASATGLLNDAAVLIVDLRGASAGNPAALPYFMSLFMEGRKKMPLGAVKSRQGEIPVSVSRKMLKNAPKFPKEMPVYILTDGKTAGVSEWAAALLKEKRNAKIIGENTAGQAYIPLFNFLWGEYMFAASHSKSLLPGGVSTWEKTGIKPDLPVAAEAALDSALARARSHYEAIAMKLLGLESLSHVRSDWEKAALNAPDSLASLPYIGSYKLGMNVVWQNGRLSLQSKHGDARSLHPLSPGLFMAAGLFENGRIQPGRGNGQSRGFASPVLKTEGRQNNTKFKWSWAMMGYLPKNEFTKLENRPLYLSFPEGPNPDMTVIYTNGRHYIFEREGKTENPEEKENEADENAYDPFADTVKNGVWVQSVLKEYPSEMEGTEAAPFEFTDMEGEYLSSGNFLENKAVVLNFWFSACGPCVAEMPAFNALKEKYADQDVSFIGINRYDDSERILKFLKKYPFNFHLIAKDEDQKSAVEKSLSDYKAVVFPTTVLIGKDGKIKFARAGYLPEYSGMLDRAIQKELGL